MGRLHAEYLAFRVRGACLMAIADVDRAAAEACAARCNEPAVYADYRELLNDPAIDAVAVCSPPQTHGQIIEAAAAAGKHIFCEKPLGCDLGSIDSALAAVRKAGVKLQVGFNRRFDAGFRQAHEAVTAGKIGKPRILHIVSRDPELPPAEEIARPAGLFLDSTVHDFDMARYLIGGEVETVYALGGAMVHPGSNVDTALITLRFANGVLGTIDNSQTVYGYDQRVEVFGSGGAISVENEKRHGATLSDKAGLHAALPLHFFRERYADSYIAELTAFVDSILEDTDPPVTGHDGRAAVVLALAAQRSYQEGRPVVVKEIDASRP
ncbi:MAG: inositol 2-dehydrogenase [Chloroflexi bacterium]|nr:inositol 2-dehydrogenase [Chloroflexota bacterium]